MIAVIVPNQGRASIDDFPNELLLLIYPLLSLKSLIAARGVSRRWRHLVGEAILDPTRRQLLDFYLQIIDRPIFLRTRQDIIPHLHSFNRDAFFDFLPENTHVPNDFEMYVKEWPARAAIGFLWPGLEDSMYHGEDTPVRDSGTRNTLGHYPPYIKNITYHSRNITSTFPSLHATTLLPGGIDIPPVVDGMGISWGDEFQEEIEPPEPMVSMDITALCVTSVSSGGGHWMVIGGKRGGERMHGIVYRGGVGGFGMHEGDVIAKTWVEYLGYKLKRGEQIAGLTAHCDRPSLEHIQPLSNHEMKLPSPTSPTDFKLAVWAM